MRRRFKTRSITTQNCPGPVILPVIYQDRQHGILHCEPQSPFLGPTPHIRQSIHLPTCFSTSPRGPRHIWRHHSPLGEPNCSFHRQLLRRNPRRNFRRILSRQRICRDFPSPAIQLIALFSPLFSFDELLPRLHVLFRRWSCGGTESISG